MEVLGFWAYGRGIRIQGLGFRFSAPGFRVERLGFEAWGLASKILGLGFSDYDKGLGLKAYMQQIVQSSGPEL